jgi:hypothetical protein
MPRDKISGADIANRYAKINSLQTSGVLSEEEVLAEQMRVIDDAKEGWTDETLPDFLAPFVRLIKDEGLPPDHVERVKELHASLAQKPFLPAQKDDADGASEQPKCPHCEAHLTVGGGAPENFWQHVGGRVGLLVLIAILFGIGPLTGGAGWCILIFVLIGSAMMWASAKSKVECPECGYKGNLNRLPTN